VTADIFDNLSSGLEKAWDKLKGARQLTAENIKEPMKDIRRALLEADVRSPTPSPSSAPPLLRSAQLSPGAHLPVGEVRLRSERHRSRLCGLGK
jgi:hypothetical protein